ncbi:MAG: hypothetical protein HY901_04525 [Deltaproteobacteria bacterium]|nr:hypothetical protein [Deltaproteobacteria bacterium]
MFKETIREIREELAASGLELDELTVARLAKVIEGASSPEERMRGLFDALGMRGLDDATIAQVTSLAGEAESGEAFVDAIFIGACPHCGSEEARSGESEPAIEDPTVGLCPACGWIWCSECESKLTREQPHCSNPQCWLQQGGEEDTEGQEPEP